jgi:hypothetical protein
LGSAHRKKTGCCGKASGGTRGFFRQNYPRSAAPFPFLTHPRTTLSIYTRPPLTSSYPRKIYLPHRTPSIPNRPVSAEREKRRWTPSTRAHHRRRTARRRPPAGDTTPSRTCARSHPPSRTTSSSYGPSICCLCLLLSAWWDGAVRFVGLCDGAGFWNAATDPYGLFILDS